MPRSALLGTDDNGAPTGGTGFCVCYRSVYINENEGKVTNSAEKEKNISFRGKQSGGAAPLSELLIFIFYLYNV